MDSRLLFLSSTTLNWKSSSTTLNWIQWRSLIVMMLWYFKFGCVHSTTIVRTAFNTLMRWYGWYVDEYDSCMESSYPKHPRLHGSISILHFLIFWFHLGLQRILHTILPYFGLLGMVTTRCSGLLRSCGWIRGDNKMRRPFEIVALKSWTHYKWSSTA